MTTMRYEIHNGDVVIRERICHTVLSDMEEKAFVEDGVVVPEYRLEPATFRQLDDAVDGLVAERFGEDAANTYKAEFLGQYLRDPHRLAPAIMTIPLLDNQIADTVRCLIGPRVVLRNSNIRITHPRSGDDTVWHTDYRPHTSPPPKLGMPPTVITVLLYLDRADDESGPLFVVPGSHRTYEQPAATSDDVYGQQTLVIEPGQVVLMNAATWHRGGANVSDRRIRRLITLQLSTVFMPPFNFETTLPSPEYLELIEQAKARRDEAFLELAGCGGLNPNSARY